MNDILPIIAQLCAAFVNSQATKETVAVYVRELQDIPPEHLQVVVSQCIRESKYLPTVGEIYDRYRFATRTSDIPPAAEAWGLVVNGLREHGRTSPASQIFEGATLKVVEMMGWKNLCNSEDQMADRAHFIKMYAEVVERMDREAKMSPEFRRLTEQSRREGKMLTMKEILGRRSKSG